MKKVLVLCLTLLVLTCSVFGCSTDKGDDKTIKIAVPDGAPAVVIFNVLNGEKNIGGYNVEVEILQGSENIGTAIPSKRADVVVMPTNGAAKIYNNGAKVKLASVNIFGVLYLIGDSQVTSLEQLKGKVVCSIGRGLSPDVSFKVILQKNNIEYVESDSAVEGKVALKYVSASPEAIQMKASKNCDYSLMGEPVVTQANNQLKTVVALDLQSEWTKLFGENSYMQAGVVFSDEVCAKTEFVNALLEKLQTNNQTLVDNYSSIKSVLQNAGSGLKVDFTIDTVNRLNVGFSSAKDSKSKIEAYFNAISEVDNTFIGGKLPDDGFYLNYEG